jgi:putative transposase
MYYHLVWATKNREAWITPERMEMLQLAFRVVAKDQGAFTHAIGGMPNHVHVAVSIPPTITVSEYVGRLKGSSSRFVGKSISDPAMDVFLWQSQYGVLTFGDRALPDVIAYIENQPHHHATNDLWRSFGHLPIIQPSRR